MVKTIGIDPVPEKLPARLWRIVLWSWGNALFGVFGFKGRTSRLAFFVFILPVISVWLGIASWFTVTEMNQSSNLYNMLKNLRFALAALTLVFLPALIIRRLHDGDDEAIEHLKGIGFFGPVTFLYRLLVEFNPSANKHGPPHILIPENNYEKQTPDPKKIG